MRRLFPILLALLLTGCTPQPLHDLPGAYRVPLAHDCAAYLFTPASHVTHYAVALACPGIELLRLYPWPPVPAWDESPATSRVGHAP